jgi:hypothetical protein
VKEVDPIVKAALEARTNKDIEQLEGLLRRALGGGKTRYLGDREANYSAISGGADPTAVIFERATNGLDAVIEMEAERRNCFTLRSPAEAAKVFFGVTHGVEELSASQREALAEFTTITVLDSDDSAKKPTIAVRDLGIGIGRGDVPGTILSLEESNKLRKPYTHGVFGKGGSTACAFSDATVVVTRRQPDLLPAGQEDRITVAVVREADAPDVGLPFFQYAVGDDNEPYSVPASAHLDFAPGTYVAHVNYQAGRMGTQQWQFEESIYASAETTLFAPTLPYRLHDARSGAANMRPEGRQKPSVLAGLGQRLGQLKVGERDEDLLGQSSWQTVPVPGVGDVRMRWWLFRITDQRRRRAAKGNVVVFTTNGQVHHAWDQAKLGLMADNRKRVGQRLFAQVDCDGIELKRRYKVFTSFREGIRRGPEGRMLEEAVAFAIASDADLDEFESEFVRESLKATAQNVSEAFRRRLNRALKTKIGGMAPAAGKTGGTKPPRPKRKEDLYAEPTTMTGPEHLTLLAGSRAVAYMEINAVDAFVPDRGEILVSVENGDPLPAAGPGDLRKGRLPVTFVAEESTATGGRSVEVALEWMRSAGGLGGMTWPIQVEVVSSISPRSPQPPKPPKGNTAKTDSGDIAFVWVNGQTDMGWADDIVGELQEMKGSDLADKMPVYAFLKDIDDPIPTLVLNREFADWHAYRRGIAKRLSDNQLAIRDERYGLGVGIAVANLELRERALRKKWDAWKAKENGVEEPLRALDPAQMQRALAETARGVVALMPDFDALLNDFDQTNDG